MRQAPVRLGAGHARAARLKLVVLRVLLVLVLLRVAAADDVDELDLEREVRLGRNAARKAALACGLATEHRKEAEDDALRKAGISIVFRPGRGRPIPVSVSGQTETVRKALGV